MPIYRRVNKEFFKKWTPEMFYVLGFFAADGYITVNKRGGQFWCIQITDKKLLEQIRAIIQAEHIISERKRDGTSILYRLQIGSIEMCNDLRRLGFTQKKTKNLAIPLVPRKYFFDFVRGYFDGDGNVWSGLIHKDRKAPSLTLQVMFTSCSLEFLRHLHKVIGSFGVEGGSMYVSKGNYSRLQFSARGALKLYDLMYNQRGPSKGSMLFLERKKKVFGKYGALMNCGRSS